jgi:hypothetical protein
MKGLQDFELELHCMVIRRPLVFEHSNVEEFDSNYKRKLQICVTELYVVFLEVFMLELFLQVLLIRIVCVRHFPGFMPQYFIGFSRI